MVLCIGASQTTICAGVLGITNPDEDLRRLDTKDFYKKMESADYTRTESSWYDKEINSLDNFKEYYSEIDPSTSEAGSEIDYSAEYQKYLKMRGCGSENELKALNKTGCFTIDDLKIEACTKLQSYFSDMKNEGLIDDSYDIDNAIDYIINNCSTTELVKCIVKPEIPPVCKTSSQTSMYCYKALKDLISKLPTDPKGKFDPEKLCSAVDKMMDILKGRAKKELEELYTSQELYKQKIATQEPQIKEIFNRADSKKKICIYEECFAAV